MVTKENVYDESGKLVFPEITNTEMIMGLFPMEWFDAVLDSNKEIEDKFFTMFDRLFVYGGKVPVKEESDYCVRGMRILRSLMKSTTVNHHSRVYVCAAIFKAICGE